MRASEFQHKNRLSVADQLDISDLQEMCRTGQVDYETYFRLIENRATKMLGESISKSPETIGKVRKAISSLGVNDLKINESYYAVPIMVTGDRVTTRFDNQFLNSLGQLDKMKLVSADNGLLIFENPQGEKVPPWPDSRLSGITYMTTFIAETSDDYNRFSTWMALNADMSLPELEKPTKLTESATSVLFHATGMKSALNILDSGTFKLGTSVGSQIETQYSIPGYSYFLSATRSKLGDYHSHPSNGEVMFVLDGNILNRHYKVKPIDYWEGHHRKKGKSEAEDRIYSKTPEISISCVVEMHVLLKEKHPYNSPGARQLLIAAKKRGIPIYLYNNDRAWLLQNKNRAVKPSEHAEALKGHPHSRKTWPVSGTLKAWLELIQAKSKADLSPRAEKLRYRVAYSPYDLDKILANDIFNNRKPDDYEYQAATKIVALMAKNEYKTIPDLVKAITAKWKNMQ